MFYTYVSLIPHLRFVRHWTVRFHYHHRPLLEQLFHSPDYRCRRQVLVHQFLHLLHAAGIEQNISIIIELLYKKYRLNRLIYNLILIILYVFVVVFAIAVDVVIFVIIYVWMIIIFLEFRNIIENLISLTEFFRIFDIENISQGGTHVRTCKQTSSCAFQLF